MKHFLAIFVWSLLLHQGKAQSTDSTTYLTEKLWVTQNLQTKAFTVIHRPTQKRYEHLKFVKVLYPQLQILDANNTMYYLETDGTLKEQVTTRLEVCGTVPHFIVWVTRTASSLEVWEDETFYDYDNQIPAKKTATIPLSEADTIVFINGKSRIDFTENFGIGINTTDPRMLILVKDGQFFVPDHPNQTFDSIDFSNCEHSLKTEKDNRYGLLGIIGPIYKRIAPFEHYLAKAEKEDGTIVYIDLEGNEY